MKPDFLKTVSPVEGANINATAQRNGRNPLRHSSTPQQGQSFADALFSARQRDNAPVERNKDDSDKPADKADNKPTKNNKVADDASSRPQTKNQTSAKSTDDAETPDPKDVTNEGETANGNAQAEEPAFHDNPMTANTALLGNQPTPAQGATAVSQASSDFAQQLVDSMEGTGAPATGALANGAAIAATTPISGAANTDATELAPLAVSDDLVAAVEPEAELATTTAPLASTAGDDTLKTETAPKAVGDALKPVTNFDNALHSHVARNEHSNATQQSDASTNTPRALPTPAQAHENVRNVVNVVAPLRNRGDGDYSVTLKLHPEHLGSLEVVVSLTGGQVSMSLNADSQGARDMLRDQMNNLREALEGAGISAGDLDVSNGDQFQRHLNGEAADSRNQRADSSSDDATAPLIHMAVPTSVENLAPGEVDVRL